MIHAEVVLEDRTELFFQLHEHAAVERIVAQMIEILKAERPDIMKPPQNAAEDFFLLDVFTNRKLDPQKSLARQMIDSGCRLRLVPVAQDHSGSNEEA